ncbi:MAG: hypothetical protein GXZ14_09255 [Ruminococcaceae bacterium]|nr:hypothetical protein [Oscillospiraceae bacterium]
MYYNIAEKVIAPLLGDDHALVSDAAVQVQQALNTAAGVGLKAQTAPLDTDRVQGILNKVSSAPTYDDVAWVLYTPIKTFSQTIVDETLKRNAEFQSTVGLRPKIIRKAERKCCEFCSKLEGEYTYPRDVPHDVYVRHNNCRCLVEYDPGTFGAGLRQNVWTKKWTTPEERDKIEARKALEPDRFKNAIQTRINKGEHKLGQSHQQYLKHVFDTPQFEQYQKSRLAKGQTTQSRLTISEDEAQQLISKYAGKGTPYITDSASVSNKEFATAPKVIGQYCTADGKWIDTKRFQIQYGKNNCHMVPVKEFLK